MTPRPVAHARSAGTPPCTATPGSAATSACALPATSAATRRRSAGAALLVAALLLLTGCSSADGDEPAARGASESDAAAPSTSPAPPDPTPAPTDPTPAPPAPTPATPTATVVMVGFAYEMPASVPTGAQVTVVNRDAEAHSFSLRGRSERLVVPPKGSMSFTAPAEPGTYEVVCEFHGGMTTSLVVA